MADVDTSGPEIVDDDPWIGQNLAGYIILQRLGEGGMGIVYLARHQSLDRLAAVKFLPGDMATDAAFVELFLREAKAAAKLSHPNIVAVHDAGVVGENIYYFIMEYVEGRDLRSIQQELGTLPVPLAVEYLRQAASALAYAHKKQVIHRDIKPENLLLTSERIIKVVDLGLAKWAGEESSMITQTGDIMGSPIYISPERLRDPHTIDHRTDVYSLGATLFHLVTGKIPYEGSSAVIMARHLTDAAPDPRDINPKLDEGISRIIMKMMAKEVGDRYQTMEEVETAFEEYQAGRAPPPLKTRRLARRNKPWLTPAVLLLAAGAAGFFLASRLTKSETTPAVAVLPKPVNPQKPPLVVADFNLDSRVNRLGGTFGSWGSSRPDPLGKAGERVERSGGTDGTGYWKINFDITTPGSSAGAWMHLNKLDATGYNVLAFQAKAEGVNNLNFLFELKGPSTGQRVIRGIGSKWQSVEIPLKELNIGSSKSLSELSVKFDAQNTGAAKGSLSMDQIEFLKKK